MCGAGGGGAGGAPLGRAPGWSGRAGRPSALPPPLLGAGRRAGRTGVRGPSWCWVALWARTSCLSVGWGSRRSSVLAAHSANRSLVLRRGLGVVACCLARCNGMVVCLHVPGLHSSVLRVLCCFRDCLGCPDCCSWGPGRSRGCTPFRSADLQTLSRRTPCLESLCFPGCTLGFWSSLSSCRCTPCLHSLGCCSLGHRLLSLGCSGRRTPWVLRCLRGRIRGMMRRRCSLVTGDVAGLRSAAPGQSCVGSSMRTRSVVVVVLGAVAVWGRRKPLLRVLRLPMPMILLSVGF